MKKTDLENRIKELELELSNLKSGAIATSQATKQALEKSDVEFLTLANYIPAYIAYINADTLRYEFVNNMYEKSFGIPVEKIIGSHIKDVIGEENYKVALKYINAAKSGKSVSYENTFDMVSGKRWLKLSYSPVIDANSKVVGIACISYDITERKQIEEKLQLKSEIISNMSEAISVVRMADGIFVYVHPHFEKMFGYKQDEMLGKHVSILNAPTEKSPKQTAKEIIDSINENGFWKGEIKNIRKDGTFFTCYANVTVFNHSKFGKICISIHTDITERKQAESELLESEKKFSTLINSMDEGYCIIEMIFDKDENPVDYRFLMINPAFEKQTGLFDAEGKTMREFAPNHEEHWFDAYGKIALTGESIRFVKEAAELNRWYDVYAFRYGKAENRQVAILFNDITEHRQIEESLRLEKENFRNSLDDSPLGVRIVTAEGNTIYANKTILNIYGYDSIEELQKTSLKNRYTTESYTEAIKRKQQREQGNLSANDYEINIVRKNGEIRNLHVFRKEVLWNGLSQFQVIYNDITKRKQAEQTLKESEEKYRTLVENIGEGIGFVNPDEEFVYANPAAERIFAVGKGELTGKNLKEFLNEQQYLEVKNQTKLREKGQSNVYENELNLPDGKKRNIIITAVPQFDDNKKFIGTYAIFRDITERKQAEQKLRESEENFRAIFENNSAAIVITEPDTTISMVNNEYCKISGYTQEELIGTSWTQQIPPEDLERLKEFNRRRLIDPNDAPDKYEFMFYKKNGEIRHALMSVAMLNNKTTVASSSDITERKQAEKALQESEEKYRNLFNNSEVGMFRTRLDGSEILEFNEKFLKILNYTFEEVKGKPSLFIWAKKDERERLLQLLKAVGRVTDFECDILNKQGDVINCMASLRSYPDTGIVEGSIMDITERKQAEEEIKNMHESLVLLNNRLEDISENERKLISRELHDQLGQSLSALKIDIGWLSRKIPSDSEEGAKMKGIAELLSSTIKDVQRISSELHPAMLEDLGLSAAMEWYCGEFKKRTGIDYHLKLDDIQLHDEKKSLALYRILQEALTNVLRHANAKKVNINLIQANDSVILEVIDDGIGIKKEKINSYKSLGFIGMRERAKKYNGTMNVSSALNKGTKLSVSIPFN